MTNKNVALIGIIGFAIFMIAYLSNENGEGLFYYVGLIGFYVGVVWGWIRLLK
jgi:hypothetical protein